MAGDVVNVKICSPLKQRIGLTGKSFETRHYSYNLPLATILKIRYGQKFYLRPNLYTFMI